MPFKFLFVPVRDPSAAETDLNSFLARHRTLAVERHWLDAGAASGWGVCVEYVTATQAAAPQGLAPRGKVDYKQLLTPAEFTVFVALRDLRKELSQAEGVPPYAVFTNEQLATMVRERVTTKAALIKIAGVGDARAEKYGGRMLDVLTSHFLDHHAADGKPV